MRTAFALAFSVFALAACGPSKTSGGGTTTPPPGDPTTTPPPGEGSGSADQPAGGDCVCTMQYDPVCGADGKTYGNACQAGCAKVEVTSKGECPK